MAKLVPSGCVLKVDFKKIEGASVFLDEDGGFLAPAAEIAAAYDLSYNFDGLSAQIGGKKINFAGPSLAQNGALLLSLNEIENIFKVKAEGLPEAKCLNISSCKYGAKLTKNESNPAFEINGMPYPVSLCSFDEKTLKAGTAKHLSGFEFICAAVAVKDILLDGNELSIVRLRKILDGYMNFNPAAKIIIKLDLGAFGRELVESETEEPVYKDYEKPMIIRIMNLLKLLRSCPEGDRVVGIGFNLSPAYFGNEEFKTDIFREHIRKKYGGIKALNNAWNTSFEEYEDVTVPAPFVLNSVTDGDFRSLEQESLSADFTAALRGKNAEFLCKAAKTVKDHYDREVLTGVFWDIDENSPLSKDMIEEYTDINELLSCSNLDFIAAPSAENGLRLPAHSFEAHDKIYINELNAAADTPGKRARLQNEFAPCINENCGCCFRINSSADFEAVRSCEKLRTVVSSKNKDKADVLAVFASEGRKLLRPEETDMILPKVLDSLCANLKKTGAAFDSIYLSDLERCPLAQYKFIVFINTFIITPVQRKFIRKKVMRDNRGVFFIYASGYCDGNKNSAGHIAELTGMGVEIKGQEVLKSEFKSGFEGSIYKLSCGEAQTCFKIVDIGAEELACYKDGEVSFACGNLAGCGIYFIGVPWVGEDCGLLRAVAEKSGARIFASDPKKDAVVNAGGGLVCVYLKEKSEIKLNIDEDTSKIVILEAGTHYFNADDLEPVAI